MKIRPVLRLLFAASLLISHMQARAATNEVAAEFSCVVPFELGKAEFDGGDTITVKQVHGTSETIKVGERFCVEGTYTLASEEKADLALFVTTTSMVSTPVEPSQVIRVKKGSGSFRLVETMTVGGYPHISFYSLDQGDSFGGVYFGQGSWVLHREKFNRQDHIGRNKGTTGGAGASTTSTNHNQTLTEYLGNPVNPPADMDPAYSKEGLTRAIQTAARKAGISVEKIEIEDSEFPFLVGVICKKGDYTKLKDQIQKLDGYVYGGYVGSETCIAMNIVPSRVYPPGSFSHIDSRVTLRMQILYDKIHNRE